MKQFHFPLKGKGIVREISRYFKHIPGGSLTQSWSDNPEKPGTNEMKIMKGKGCITDDTDAN